MGKKKSSNIGDDQRQCNLTNNFGLQGKEVWENCCFPAPPQDKTAAQVLINEDRREEGHSHCRPVIEDGTSLPFLSLSSFCLSMDCHHYQCSQVSHCQLTVFFHAGPACQVNRFPYLCTHGIGRVYFLIKLWMLIYQILKRKQQFHNYFHLLFSPFCITPTYVNKLILCNSLRVTEFPNTDFPRRKETLIFLGFFGCLSLPLILYACRIRGASSSATFPTTPCSWFCSMEATENDWVSFGGY